MTDWLEIAKTTLLPLSEAKNIQAALREWHYTGDVFDYEACIETRQLCHQEELRFHFTIKNRLNSNEMLVGSTCILRFSEIEVADEDGKIVSGDARRLVLNRQRDKLLREAARKRKEAEAEVERQKRTAERKRIADQVELAFFAGEWRPAAGEAEALAQSDPKLLIALQAEWDRRDREKKASARIEAARQEAERREAYLDRIRELWLKATRSRPFIASLANWFKQNGALTPRQQSKLDEMFKQFRI